MNILVAILIFGLIVLFHEFGHFIVARRCGVKVLEFSIGMGPKLFSVRGKDTVYSVRCLPLGGYCSMLGEDTDEVPEEGSFTSKPVWQRFLVIAAGPIFNFILAFLMALLVVSFSGVNRCVLKGVTDGFPAKEAGLEAGDIITRIDRQPITIFDDVTLYLYMHPGKTVNVTVKRPSADGSGKAEKLSFTITPKYNDEYKSYMLGIETSGVPERVKNIGEAFFYSAYQVKFTVKETVDSLKMLISRKISANELTGPVGIVNVIGETVNESKQYGLGAVLLNLIYMTLLLSANLGVMNLLPLPALDGGRLVFLVIEGILGHPINRKFEGLVHLTGFFLLMALMAFVMFNDIRNLIR
jgi:regulator of sigma E protease